MTHLKRIRHETVFSYFVVYISFEAAINVNGLGPNQCDQIWRFFGLWPTFKCFWQHLICPNFSHS